MTTTVFTVSTEAQLAAAITAIDSQSTGSGAAFEIDIAKGATLTETSALPTISLTGSDSLTIQGNGAALDGAGQYQGLNVASGTVAVDNLTIQNAVVTGGANGGYGLGGGLYVGTGANVTLDDVTFANDSAVGGNGDGSGPAGSGIPGVGAGADIFQIQGGSLTIEGGNLGVGTVTGGLDLSGNIGYAWGTGIFISGSNTLTLAPNSGDTLTITGVITDEHGLVSADVNEADVIIDGGGTVILSPELSTTAATANTFTGGISLDSGTLELTSAQAAGSGAIWFGYAGNGNPVPTLKLDQGAFTKGSFANWINGYDVGDTIDFAGVSAQSAAYNSQAQTLTVGGETVNLALQTYLTSSQVSFVTSSDGHGGTDVTLAKLVNPTITGTVAGQTTSNGAALDPFAKVTICDPNAGAGETLFITLSGSGTLKDGAGFSGLGTSGAASGIYVLQGSAAAVTKELDALVFTPAAGSANSSAETTFTLQDISTAGTTVTNNATTVTNTDTAVASVISGTVAGQVVGVGKTINPFAHAVISDANANSTDTVYIDVSSGTLSDGAGFSGLTASSVAGLYSIKAQSAAQATAEVEALVYTPAPTGTPTGVGVQFVVQNSAGIVTTNSTTSLTVDPGPKAAKVSTSLQVGTGVNLTSLILGAATPGIKGDTLSIVADNGSSTLGSFALVNGQLIYAASTSALSHIVANGSQTDTLGYTIADQYGDTATGSVAITLTNPASETITAGYLLGIPVGLATVQGNGGPDVINVGGLLNTIYANGGNDLITAGCGLDTVYAGAGSDTIILSGSSNTVSGGDGWDTVTGSAGSTTITLGNGNDSISAGGCSNSITLGAGTDSITLGGTGNKVTLNGSSATVTGGQGCDTITVNGGNDKLTFAGASSNAIINGVAAVNISDLGSALTVKIGSSTQTDSIAGFGTSDPYGVIDLLNGAGGFASTAQIMSNLHSDGHGGTLLALGSQGSIDFAGTAASQLHASNFRIG